MNQAVRPALFEPQSVSLQAFNPTPAQLDLVWDMNRQLSRREFDQFIETSRALGLNPLKRQVCAIVLNRHRGSRHLAIVTTIAGLRAIADRTGTYRPDNKPARIKIDLPSVHPKANPLGILECTVTPYRYAHGRWHPIVGQVWWNEIAPIRKDEDGDSYLDRRTPWPTRPRGQIAKCAEAAALRAGWPENLANVYSEDEMDRARSAVAEPPSITADAAKRDRILAQKQPKGTLLIDLGDGGGLTQVEVGKFHDRISEIISTCKPEQWTELLRWREQQRIAFQQFFGHDKNAALDLKRRFEQITDAVAAGASHGQ